MASSELKKVLQRLQKDLLELQESPVPNISACPLDTDMLEWHGNIRHNDTIYHLILVFPKEYPCRPPSLEMVPPGFGMVNMVVMKGIKGTKVCLDIFSDFVDTHPEWVLLKDSGWSPSYSVQAVLLNFLSYFHDQYTDHDGSLADYVKVSKTFVCSDCGHSAVHPYPPLEENVNQEGDPFPSTKTDHVAQKTEITLLDKDNYLNGLFENKIMDYISRETFSDTTDSSNDQIFGYGLILSPYSDILDPTSPCEFLTANSFSIMCTSFGGGKSILRESISYFLPLHITADHGSRIKPIFEDTMTKIAKKFRFRFSFTNNYSHVIINVLCHIMQTIAHKQCQGDNLIDGYFQIHRLFLWAIETYPMVQKCVEKRIKNFLSNPGLGNRRFPFDFDYCFALLSVSNKYSWTDISEVYLREHWRRSSMWPLNQVRHFGYMDLPVDERLQKSFLFTEMNRSQLAFQVTYLKMVKPDGMTRDDILKRYSDNLGFPSLETVVELKKIKKRITDDIKSYDDWFHIIGLPVPCEIDLFNDLKESVRYALVTKGYFSSYYYPYKKFLFFKWVK